MKDGGSVVSVGEPARLDKSWQKDVNVMVVGFGTAQFRREGTKGIGVDDLGAR